MHIPTNIHKGSISVQVEGCNQIPCIQHCCMMQLRLLSRSTISRNLTIVGFRSSVAVLGLTSTSMEWGAWFDWSISGGKRCWIRHCRVKSCLLFEVTRTTAPWIVSSGLVMRCLICPSLQHNLKVHLSYTVTTCLSHMRIDDPPLILDEHFLWNSHSSWRYSVLCCCQKC